MITKHQTSFTVMPQHTNMHYPMVFGGEMLARMDIAAAECVRIMLISANKDLVAVTVNVKDVTFYIGAQVGDIVTFECSIAKLGLKSIQVGVTGYRHNKFGKEKISDAWFTFVTKINPTDTKGTLHGLSLLIE